MPHKHKRRGLGKATDFDLPPSTIAKSLPARSSRQPPHGHKNGTEAKDRNFAPQLKKEKDDTPRAFARMMQFQATGKRPRSGLDDGDEIAAATKSSRKRKQRENLDSAPDPSQAVVPDPEKYKPETVPASTSTTKEAPRVPSISTPASNMKIQPHERLTDFAARVDQSLPVAGLKAKGAQSRDPLNLKKQRTKHERRLLRLQNQWREEEKRRKTKQDEVVDELEDAKEENALLWGPSIADAALRKGKKRKMKIAGDGDPWAEIARKRKIEGTEQRDLHDVVQAPPRLGKLKARFKDTGG